MTNENKKCVYSQKGVKDGVHPKKDRRQSSRAFFDQGSRE
jgi:hypothetical protein